MGFQVPTDEIFEFEEPVDYSPYSHYGITMTDDAYAHHSMKMNASGIRLQASGVSNDDIYYTANYTHNIYIDGGGDNYQCEGVVADNQIYVGNLMVDKRIGMYIDDNGEPCLVYSEYEGSPTWDWVDKIKFTSSDLQALYNLIHPNA